MTNTEIIQAIKAEIERLKGQLIRGACAAQIEMETNCKDEAYNEVLSFLSTLESEKPMNQEELEEEYKDYVVNDPVYSKLVNRNAGLVIARHFAELGAEHAREKMMAEAVEGEVCIPNVWVEHKEGKELVVRAEISKELGFKFGDKVRIIIVKED